MKNKRTLVVAAALVGLSAAPVVSADTAYWTDWNAKSTGIVSGVLTVGSTTVDVTFSGAYSFAQISGGTNYWSPNAPYLSAAVGNAPPAADIVGLYTGGAVTITFSQPVHNPLIALVSWNGNTVNFAEGSNLQYLSSGSGYWGSGTFFHPTSISFQGSGELHGVIQLTGDFSSISFSHTSENWHGLTVGVLGVTPAIPEPETYALLLAGLGLLGIMARRRKQSAA
jgi:hypothetical protein